MEINYRIELTNKMKELNLPLVAAELGCAEGYFSAELLKGGIKHLYMVDNYGKIEGQTGDGNNDAEWHNSNLNKAMQKVSQIVSAEVTLLRGISWDMAREVKDESLGMLYLDACHSYECVLKDLQAWGSKVKQRGIIAGHDYLNKSYGVKQAVADFCAGKYQINVIRENKDEDAGFWFQL